MQEIEIKDPPKWIAETIQSICRQNEEIIEQNGKLLDSLKGSVTPKLFVPIDREEQP